MAAMADTVNILLSTYNGMRFLEQQIDSLIAQSYPHILITARDDGSTDDSYKKLMQYAKQYHNFMVFRGKRKGAAASFLELLNKADSNSKYYAFCDQDDVWLPHKIRDAVAAMGTHDSSKPLMYFSRLEYVDSQLRHLGYSKVYQMFGFTNAIVENIVTGCTIVLNQEARKLICERIPTIIIMHDRWCYLVVSALGQVIYDERPNIKYRQHGANAIGSPTSWWEVLWRMLARYLDPNKGGYRASDQAKEFHRCYANHLSISKLKSIEGYLEAKKGIWSRIKYAKRMEVWKQSRIETAFLRLRIIIGRF